MFSSVMGSPCDKWEPDDNFPLGKIELCSKNQAVVQYPIDFLFGTQYLMTALVLVVPI